MECWMFVHALQGWNEEWIANYKGMFDAWEDGGVRGIAVGRLGFPQADGSNILTHVPDAKVYESFGVSAPPEQPRDLEKEKKFSEILDNAASRGWRTLFFDVHPGGGSLPPEQDPYGEAWFAATAQDLMNAYPQMDGIIMDCPGEQHYELARHNVGELFELREGGEHWLGFDLRRGERERFEVLGYDVGRMERGITHLRSRFHNLTPDLVRYHAPGGTLGGLQLFDINEDGLYWLRARQQTATDAMSAMRRAIDRVDRKIMLGGIPRTAAFSALTAQDYRHMGDCFDYVFPKHYYWNRGIDGLYGTVARWAWQLSKWNPALTDADCFAVIKSVFGLELPGVRSQVDLELGFPEEFFSEVVFSETRRALEAIPDEDKVVCWISTGRRPHGGDAMTARELEGILQASKQAGLKRFMFHPDPDLGAPEWHVISRKCGNAWRPDPEKYWPSDTGERDRRG